MRLKAEMEHPASVGHRHRCGNSNTVAPLHGESLKPRSMTLRRMPPEPGPSRWMHWQHIAPRRPLTPPSPNAPIQGRYPQVGPCYYGQDQAGQVKYVAPEAIPSHRVRNFAPRTLSASPVPAAPLQAGHPQAEWCYYGQEHAYQAGQYGRSHASAAGQPTCGALEAESLHRTQHLAARASSPLSVPTPLLQDGRPAAGLCYYGQDHADSAGQDGWSHAPAAGQYGGVPAAPPQDDKTYWASSAHDTQEVPFTTSRETSPSTELPTGWDAVRRVFNGRA